MFIQSVPIPGLIVYKWFILQLLGINCIITMVVLELSSLLSFLLDMPND